MSDDDDKRGRIVEARLKLRERFLERMQGTPSMADGAPAGSGPPNRHGMPRLPVDQYETRKWPVLDLGIKPEVTTATWSLRVDGAVARPLTLRWDDLLALDQVEDVSDFHCVTKWSKMDLRWRGVRLGEVLALAEPADDARFLMCHASDGYTVNLPFEEALKADVLLAHTVDGSPLPADHGGPCRVITPQLYAWKGAKWVSRIELLTEDQLGFWELRGYSNTAYPWRNDRYS
jgi:DMSO/TMAO reductase YedYZ molybdopterin-dependent catalytic subunit